METRLAFARRCGNILRHSSWDGRSAFVGSIGFVYGDLGMVRSGALRTSASRGSSWKAREEELQCVSGRSLRRRLRLEECRRCRLCAKSNDILRREKSHKHVWETAISLVTNKLCVSMYCMPNRTKHLREVDPRI